MASPRGPRPRGRERAVGTSQRAYRSLLRAYPRELRDGYGDEMARCFRDLCREELEGGVIEESGQRPDPEADDERRRYYRLTGFGGEVLTAEVERLEGLVRAARRKGAFPPAPKPSPEGA